MMRQLTGLFTACAVILFAGAAFAYPAVVTTDLNLRSDPSARSRVIGTMPEGSIVDVIDCRGSWCEVEWRGRVGFASRNFLAERAGQRPQAAPPSIVVPLPGFGIEIRPEFRPDDRPDFRPRPDDRPDFRPRPDRPRRDVCNERRAGWAIGERARPRVIDRAADESGARTVRVVRPGEFVTRDFRRDRLTIEVDRRNRIVDLSCQ